MLTGKPLKRTGLLNPASAEAAKSELATMFDLPTPPAMGARDKEPHRQATAEPPSQPPHPMPVDAHMAGPGEGSSPTEPRTAAPPQENHGPGKVTKIPIGSIIPSPVQPRIVFDYEALLALAQNIDAVGGLVQPIRVRDLKDGRYELIAGERRWRACKLNEASEIEAIVVDISEEKALLETAAENINREDLSPFEIALMVENLRKKTGSGAVSELSALLGVPRRDIYRYQAFLRLPEACQAVLRRKPDLLPAGYVEETIRHVEQGNSALVEQAFELAAAGKLKRMNIPKWVEHKLNTAPAAASVALVKSGKRVGLLAHRGNKLSVSISDPELAATVRENIEGALRSAGVLLSIPA